MQRAAQQPPHQLHPSERFPMFTGQLVNTPPPTHEMTTHMFAATAAASRMNPPSLQPYFFPANQQHPSAATAAYTIHQSEASFVYGHHSLRQQHHPLAALINPSPKGSFLPPQPTALRQQSMVNSNQPFTNGNRERFDHPSHLRMEPKRVANNVVPSTQQFDSLMMSTNTWSARLPSLMLMTPESSPASRTASSSEYLSVSLSPNSPLRSPPAFNPPLTHHHHILSTPISPNLSILSNSSTPRPIRKTLESSQSVVSTPNQSTVKCESNVSTTRWPPGGSVLSSNDSSRAINHQPEPIGRKSETSSSGMRSKSNKSPVEGQNEAGKKMSRSGGHRKEASSDFHNHHHHQHHHQRSSRQLPLRSKNIDLSKYLSNVTLNDNRNADNNQQKQQSQRLKSPEMRCAFCENNQEPKEVFMSHNLKDTLGKIVCPILRNFVCPKCGESGDYAHTDKYCPVTQRKQKENKIRKFFNQAEKL